MTPPDGLAEGERRRDEGLELTRVACQELIDRLQAPLIELAKSNGEVTADDAHNIMTEWGVTPEKPNGMGHLFRRPHWKYVRHQKSHRADRRAGSTAVWSYESPAP